MHDAFLVRGVERVADLRDDVNGAADRQRSFSFDQRLEVSSVEILEHHEERAVVEAAHIGHFHDVRMADRRRCDRFVVKAANDARVRRELRVQALERHALSNQKMLGLVDDADSTFADPPHDLVTLLCDRADPRIGDRQLLVGQVRAMCEALVTHDEHPL
jgi:hypothetical protein